MLTLNKAFSRDSTIFSKDSREKKKLEWFSSSDSEGAGT